MTHASALPDPFDVKHLRENPPSVPVTERVLVSIAARRPTRQEFIRVNPNPELSIDGSVIEFTGPSGREDYWVPPGLRAAAPDELKPVRIFVAMSKQGVLFLWPARLPSPDNQIGRRWHESALAGAELAKTHWVKIAGNRAAGAYDVVKASGDLGEPEWPDMDLGELLRLAFGDGRVIDAPDHDVLRSLRGEM